MVARQALYHLIHTLNTSYLVYFSERISSFYLGSVLDHDPPTSASQVAGITGTYHHTQLFLTWDLNNFFAQAGWPQTQYVSCIAGI
jgi:hypothetical protein